MSFCKRYFKCGCIDELSENNHYVVKLCTYHKKKGGIKGRNLTVIHIEPLLLSQEKN